MSYSANPYMVKFKGYEEIKVVSYNVMDAIVQASIEFQYNNPDTEIPQLQSAETVFESKEQSC